MAQLTKGQTFAGADTVTAAKLNDLVDNATISNIVNADISASAAIALSKLATGALPTGITVASANIVDGTIVNADISVAAAIVGSKLADGAINNDKVASDAAIAGTKVAPNFGDQNIVTTGTLGAGATTLAGALTLGNNNIVAGTGDGVKIGTATTQKLGFFDATPIVRPAGAAQAAVATTAATDVTPFGYTEAQANAIVALVNEMRSVLVNLGLMKGAA
jgi:hypothetical protein